MDIEIKWEYILAIAIVVTVGVALALGTLNATDFIAILGMILAFLSGVYAVRTLSRELAEVRKLEKSKS